MGDRPTFSLKPDWVALLELKPAGRTVYDILRVNAVFGRNGVPTHAVHVTASWFTEMTSHWENPVAPATARRGMNELIQKGALIRLNDPQDGTGFLVAFVTDPGEKFKGPVSGFEHAKRVSKRCGTRSFYERKEELPGLPSVTGVRLDTRRAPAGRSLPPPARGKAAPADETEDLFPSEEFDEPSAESAPGDTADEAVTATPEMQEFAELLEERTSRMADAKLRLMPGACERLAEKMKPALDQGWDPQTLVNRLASELNPRINSPEAFLASKAKDLGGPPKIGRPRGANVNMDELDGLREADATRRQEPEVVSDPAEQAKIEQLAAEYRQNRARRLMVGPGSVYGG